MQCFLLVCIIGYIALRLPDVTVVVSLCGYQFRYSTIDSDSPILPNFVVLV